MIYSKLEVLNSLLSAIEQAVCDLDMDRINILSQAYQRIASVE
jgi:hypothetical protein